MVEVIMAAILGALAAGATDGIKDVAKTGLKDGYDKLKETLFLHGSKASAVSTALEQVEARPESKARQAVLEEELSESAMVKDPQIMAAATSLLELVRSMPGAGSSSQVASGTGIAQADRNSSATVTMTNSQK